MFAILVTCLSMLYATITFIKSRERRNRVSFYHNADMENYYDRKAESMLPVALQKALLLATVTLERNYKSFLKEKKIMVPLHGDRIISAEMWKGIKNAEEDIEFERKEIMAEAQELRQGWDDKIFDEAREILKKKGEDRNIQKMNDDPLFLKKREVLTKELMKRYEFKIQVSKV